MGPVPSQGISLSNKRYCLKRSTPESAGFVPYLEVTAPIAARCLPLLLPYSLLPIHTRAQRPAVLQDLGRALQGPGDFDSELLGISCYGNHRVLGRLTGAAALLTSPKSRSGTLAHLLDSTIRTQAGEAWGAA